MPALRTIPGLKILLCILFGFTVANILPLQWSPWYNIVASISTIVLLLLYKRRSYEHTTFSLVAGLTLILFSSSIYLRHQKVLIQKETLLSQSAVREITLLEKSKRKNSWRYLSAVAGGPADGLKLYAYSRSPLPYPVGTVLSTKGQIQAYKAPQNPDQFDYRGHLLRKGIFGRMFLDEKDISVKSKASSWKYAHLKWRDYLLSSLEQYLLDDELALAQALLLGYREEMPGALRDKFRESGNMHLLAISGMHMGIIAWLLHLLFQRLFPYRRQKKWALVATSSALWAFLALCSFPSSGVRACFMITLFMLGRHYMRGQNSYNLLFCCAAFMLLIKPGYIHDLGFQLSCLAVLGILLFYPMIYPHLQFQNKLLDAAGSLAALGISAQLGTLGISMHYFHVFSPWFWLTGIPGAFLATINMILGVLFLILATVLPAAASIFSSLFSNTLKALIQCMEWSYILQWHHFEHIFWPISMVLSYYAMLFFYKHFSHNRRFNSLIGAMSSVVLFFTFFYIQKIETVNQSELCKVKGLDSPVYELSQGQQLLIFNPHRIPREKIDFLMKEHRIRNGIKSIAETDQLPSFWLKSSPDLKLPDNENKLLSCTYIEGDVEKSIELNLKNRSLDLVTIKSTQNAKLKEEMEAMDLPR